MDITPELAALEGAHPHADHSLDDEHVTVARRPETCGGVGMQIATVLVSVHHDAVKPSKKTQ